jgi:hypothetical protein
MQVHPVSPVAPPLAAAATIARAAGIVGLAGNAATMLQPTVKGGVGLRTGIRALRTLGNLASGIGALIDAARAVDPQARPASNAVRVSLQGAMSMLLASNVLLGSISAAEAAFADQPHATGSIQLLVQLLGCAMDDNGYASMLRVQTRAQQGAFGAVVRWAVGVL